MQLVTDLQWQVLLYKWILTGADLYLGLLSKSKNATASALSPSSVGWLPSNHLWDSNVRFDSHLFWQIFRLRLVSNMHCTMRLFPLQSVNRTIYQNMYLAPHFFQLHYFRWQIFEENIWSLSLSVYIGPLESWTIIAIIVFNQTWDLSKKFTRPKISG